MGTNDGVGVKASIVCPVGVTLDDIQGILYVGTGTHSHRLRAVVVPSKGQRRSKHTYPLAMLWTLVQSERAKARDDAPNAACRLMSCSVVGVLEHVCRFWF